MTWVPPKKQLHGLPAKQALCFGMPHLGARYRHATGDAHKLVVSEKSRCQFCGRPPKSAHHEPPKGIGGRNKTFRLVTPKGEWLLRPALIALCGHGTGGCHGMRHTGQLRIWWEWHDEEAAKAWWSGELLASGWRPHDKRLLQYGGWVLESDKMRVDTWRRMVQV